MSKHVTIVGGAGYIGQRLAPHLVTRGYKVVVIDPCILCPFPDLGPNVELIVDDIRPILGRKSAQRWLMDTIIYLAGFHDVPWWDQLTHLEQRMWTSAANEIMIDIPAQLCKLGKEVIYFSSMRAITHEGTFYGNVKATAERILFQRLTILRFGTVHGLLDAGMYNRTITVPNNFGLRRELPDEHWKAYTTDIRAVLSWTLGAMQQSPGQVVNVTDSRTPETRETLPLVVSNKEIPEIMKKEVHPAIPTAHYYDLPLPKEIS